MGDFPIYIVLFVCRQFGVYRFPESGVKMRILAKYLSPMVHGWGLDLAKLLKLMAEVFSFVVV